MPAHTARLLSLLFLTGAFGVAACQPEPEESQLTGQVFVVKPGGESLRLGDVRVQLFEEEAIHAHLEERQRQISLRRGELREQLARLEEEAGERAAARARAKENYQQREAEIQAELTAFVEKAEERATALALQIDANAAFIGSMDELPAPPEGVPSREEFEAYDERRAKWLSMKRAERGSWAEALENLNLELEAEIENITTAREEKVLAFADELQELDEVIAEKRTEAEAATDAIANLKEELEALHNPDNYLTDLPSPVRQDWTDADGEFSMTVKKDRRYAIFAHAERRIEGDEPTRFQWFLWTSPPEESGSDILLSNHNQVSGDAPANLIDLSGDAPFKT